MQREQVLLMLNFCKLAGIEVKNMSSQVGSDGNQLILTREDLSDMAKASQTITITLHAETNSIDMKKHIQVKYDFQPIQKEGEQEVYSYQVVDNQAFYLFEVKDQQLSQYSSVVYQNITEDTLGNSSGIIVDFDSYYDTLNEDKRRIVECQKNIIDTASFSYPVPDGYSILDGIEYISEAGNKSK